MQMQLTSARCISQLTTGGSRILKWGRIEGLGAKPPVGLRGGAADGSYGAKLSTKWGLRQSCQKLNSFAYLIDNVAQILYIFFKNFVHFGSVIARFPDKGRGSHT